MVDYSLLQELLLNNHLSSYDPSGIQVNNMQLLIFEFSYKNLVFIVELKL